MGLIIDDDGNRFWFKDENRHRVGGPAVEFVDGYRAWYLEDRLHREDGPAIEWSDEGRYWYIGGLRHTEKMFKEKINLEIKKL